MDEYKFLFSLLKNDPISKSYRTIENFKKYITSDIVSDINTIYTNPNGDNDGTKLNSILLMAGITPEIIKLLVDRGCNFHEPDSDGHTAFNILITLEQCSSFDFVGDINIAISYVIKNTDIFILDDKNQSNSPIFTLASSYKVTLETYEVFLKQYNIKNSVNYADVITNTVNKDVHKIFNLLLANDVKFDYSDMDKIIKNVKFYENVFLHTYKKDIIEYFNKRNVTAASEDYAAYSILGKLSKEFPGFFIKANSKDELFHFTNFLKDKILDESDKYILNKLLKKIYDRYDFKDFFSFDIDICYKDYVKQEIYSKLDEIKDLYSSILTDGSVETEIENLKDTIVDSFSNSSHISIK
jgi:hypothetical protein